MKPRTNHQSIFLPLLFITVGVFMLLSTFKVIEGSGVDLAVRLWPLILILGGVDHLYRREGFVGAVVFIGLGVVLLGDNLGTLTVDAWDLMLRLWPIILVAVGIDLLLRQRTLWITVLGTLLGLALIAAIVWFVIFGAVIPRLW